MKKVFFIVLAIVTSLFFVCCNAAPVPRTPDTNGVEEVTDNVSEDEKTDDSSWGIGRVPLQ